MLRAIQILLVVLTACSYPALAETNYSKTVQLPPLRVSFSDLQTVLDKGASLMNAANSSIPIWREEIELQKGELRVKMTGHRLDTEGAKIPISVDSFEYTAITRDPAPISHLEFSFADYRRSFSVKGQSPEQVDAVFSALREDLSKLSTTIGGTMPKIFLGFPTIMILMLILLWLGAFWLHTRHRILLLSISICALLLAALLLLPIDDLLAGFSAIRGDASFVVRYGPEISLWGLVVGVVAIPLTLIPLLSGTARTAKETAPNNVPKKMRRKRRAP